MTFAPPRPRAAFTPLSQWPDQREYVLSDRIWQTGEATRARIDALLSDGIAQGRPAVDIAADLEQFLQPNRRGVRTRTPYGTDGSFDARRLARSETTAAHALAGQQARLHNPAITRSHFRLSAVHKGDPGDSCERWAALDEEQGGFAPEDCPLPVLDTHPQCICHNWDETGDINDLIDQLRVDLYVERGIEELDLLAERRARRAPWTVLAGSFANWLLGRYRRRQPAQDEDLSLYGGFDADEGL